MHQRITHRGWVSLTCLVVSLALGVYKIWLEAASSAERKLESQRSSQLLQSANDKLIAQEAELGRTAKLQTEQSKLLLLLALASAAPVVEATWTSDVVDLDPRLDPIVRLFGMFVELSETVESMIQLDIYLQPFHGTESGVRIAYRDRSIVYSDFRSRELDPKLDPLAVCPPFQRTRDRIGYECHAITLRKAFGLSDRHNAASAFRGMSEDAAAIHFKLSLRKDFPTQAAAEQFIRDHPDLKPLGKLTRQRDSPQELAFALPENFVERAFDFAKAKLSKGKLEVSLDGQNVALAVETRIAEEKRSTSGIEFLLKASSPVAVQFHGRNR